MKLLQELRKNPIITGDFENLDSVFTNFNVSPKTQENIEILYADYNCPPYEGYATVFYYDKTNDIYCEVYGSHCSCYGLENQWNPEIIHSGELEQRLIRNDFFGNQTLKDLYMKS